VIIRARPARGENAERASSLKESDERFRVLVESIRDYAVFMLDRDGRVQTWNTGAALIKGYQREEIIGKPIVNSDIKAIITGKPLFTIDQEIPGMKYAVYQKGPSFGAKVKTWNEADIKKMPGVVNAFVIARDNPDGAMTTGDFQEGIAIV